MPRPKLPELARRVRIDLTISRAALLVLDALTLKAATTRSAYVESIVMAAFAASPREDEAKPKRAKTR